MREKCSFDYAVIRLVPRVEREEFFNVGVILSCPAQKILAARIYLDEQKLKVLAPAADFGKVKKYLEIIEKICAGAKDTGIIGQLTPRERFYWLTAVRSTIIQTSSIHTGFCIDAEDMLEHLFETTVL
jgi:hypothetical protein